jgi:hypothetical protein
MHTSNHHDHAQLLGFFELLTLNFVVGFQSPGGVHLSFLGGGGSTLEAHCGVVVTMAPKMGFLWLMVEHDLRCGDWRNLNTHNAVVW